MSSPGETAPLTGWLYEAQYRGRPGDDYEFTGHVNVAGQQYQVRLYPRTIRGTAKRRWWMKLIPEDDDS